LRSVSIRKEKVMQSKQPRRSRRVPQRLHLLVLEDRCLLSTYTVTDLGFIHEAYALNDVGQVVGFGVPFDGSQGRGYLWDQGTLTDLGELPGASGSVPRGINISGQIVGGSGGSAFLWQDGVISDLDGLRTASGINNAGQVVGGASLWQDGQITDLGSLGGGGTTAEAINDAGMVVGFSSLASGDFTLHAFLWQDGTMTDLGAPPGDRDSTATAINNAGTIVGLTGLLNDDAPVLRASLYASGAWNVFGPDGSAALGINDAGQVVGSMPAFGGPIRNHAFLYADGSLTDLNSLIPAESGLVLESATAINQAGQIVGLGWSADGRQRHGFLLTPDTGGVPQRVSPDFFQLAASVGEAARREEVTPWPPAGTLSQRAAAVAIAPLAAGITPQQATDAAFAIHQYPESGATWPVEGGAPALDPSLDAVGFVQERDSFPFWIAV
jgi:probable HAF family extracellular repeat protein